MLTSVVNCTDGRVVPVNCKNCTIFTNCALPTTDTGYRVQGTGCTPTWLPMPINCYTYMLHHFAALVMLHRLLHNAMHVVGHTHVGLLCECFVN